MTPARRRDPGKYPHIPMRAGEAIPVARQWLPWHIAPMSDELKEFVHERFRRTDGKLDQLIELSTGFAQRLGSLEQQLASLRTDFAHLREDFVRIEHRLDRLDARVERIEQRLNLVEA
jgi:septal ring factor EnvC (AmiA/AmiB activator)